MRGCLVGCGFFGQIHLEAWRRMPDVTMVGTCDADPTKGTHTQLDQMLDELRPDFLDVATRPELHLEMVQMAVERGIPVICQKPLAPRWDDAVRMVTAAEAAGVPLVIHENWRWQPWYRAVAAELQKGLIGEPVTYTFRIRKFDGDGPEAYAAQPYFRGYERLLLYETLVHPLDTARFLFGEISGVYAQARQVNPVIVGEDQVLLVTSHGSGLGGLIDGHRFLDLRPDSPPLGDFTVDGVGASLVVDAGTLGIAAECRPQLSLLTGLAVIDALKLFVPETLLGLKWPNDVWLRGRKVCGILVETASQRPERVVIGVGINVGNSFRTAPPDIRQIATSLVDELETAVSAPAVLLAFLSAWPATVRAFADDDLHLPNRWQRHCVLTIRAIRLTAGNAVTEGRCAGIDERGALQIDTLRGRERHIAGTVRLLAE